MACMKHVKGLYYHLGRLHCPVHGHTYVDFVTGQANPASPVHSVKWVCTAPLPSGGACQNRATFSSFEQIRDTEVRTLAVNLYRQTLRH